MFSLAAFYFGLSFGGVGAGRFSATVGTMLLFESYFHRVFPSDSCRRRYFWATGKAGTDNLLVGNTGSHDFGCFLFVMDVVFVWF